MEYAIQRRGIFLAPPSNLDLDWLFLCFESDEIWESYGFERNGRMGMLRAFRDGNLVVGILHRVTPRKRIGFVIMFPPDDGRDYWEFSYAIPEVADRDAFSALSATDAMAHYMFEHLGVEAMGWRAWDDNRAARAVIARLGYEPNGERWVGNRRQIMYRLSRSGWAKRREKLHRGESEHPSGIGSTFVTLSKFPWEPIEVAPPQPQERVLPVSDMPKKTAPSSPTKAPSAAEPSELVCDVAKDHEIELTVQALGRRDIYSLLGWDRSASVLFARALRRHEVELESLRVGEAWIGFVVVVPPKSSTFRLFELDIAIVRLKEQTHERRVEAMKVAVQTFFERHPDAESVIVPMLSNAAELMEAAQDAGLLRLPDDELSPLPFRRPLELIAYRARRAA